MTVLYLSRGNIPSKWANSIQAMKMAEAFSSLLPDFAMVTQIHPDRLDDPRFDYESWYGIRQPFAIHTLPNPKIRNRSVFKRWRFRSYDRLAGRYAIANKAPWIYSRSPHATQTAMEGGIPSVLEAHTSHRGDHFPLIVRLTHHPNFIGLVTITPPLAQMYREAGVPKEKILVWPDAVNLAAFQNLPEKELLRRKLGMPLGRFIALHCGHLYAQRGIDDVVAAAAQHPEIHFMFVGGNTNHVRDWKARCRDLANVVFRGFVDHALVPHYLKAADLLLMPYSRYCSTQEWMSPMKLFEYMASGTVIAASKLPMVQRHLAHGRNALFFEPDHPESLSRTLDHARLNRQQLTCLAAQARRDVTPFTWERRAQAILKAFQLEPQGTALTHHGQSAE